MKKIELKDNTERQILSVALEQGSGTIKELQKIEQITSMIKDDTEFIEMSDEDYAYVKAKFESCQWNTSPEVRKLILEFSKKLE